MPFQNSSLNMVLVANPPKLATQYSKGTTLDAYLTQLVDALVAAFPDRGAAIRARSLDLKRRFKVMAKKQYEHFREPGDGSFYLEPQQAGGGGGSIAALPPALVKKYSIKKQPGVRSEVAGVMGIDDKGHQKHGANFSSAQTLKQIIDNLFEPVSRQQQAAAVAAKLKQRYGYDPTA